MKRSILKKWMVTLVIILLYFNIGIQGTEDTDENLSYEKMDIDEFTIKIENAFKLYTEELSKLKYQMKLRMKSLAQRIKYFQNGEGPITQAKSYDSTQKNSNDDFSKKLDYLKNLQDFYSAKTILYKHQAQFLKKTCNKLEIKLNKEKKEALEKLENEKNDLIKDSKTALSDSKILHQEAITELKNKNEQKITELNNKQEEEIMNLKTMYNKEMSDELHDVHYQYIQGIIIGSIVVIVGLIVFFCTYFGCFKHKRKAKNEIENSDIEAFGELSVSQIQIAPGACPGALGATQGEDSISFCIVLGNVLEMSTEEHEISGRQITGITAQKEEYSTKEHVDSKELQVSGINQIPDYESLQEDNCDNIICNAKTDLTAGGVFWKKSILNEKCYVNVENQEGV